MVGTASLLLFLLIPARLCCKHASRPKPRWKSAGLRAWLALLYILKVASSYLIMLAVMTMNIG